MIVGLLLAAGFSRRYGEDKRLVKIGGVPMALVAAENLAPHVDRVVVALRPEDQALIDVFAERGIEVCLVASAMDGMGSTLAEAVGALPEALDGLLVALADMPFIEASTYGAVRSALDGGLSLVRPMVSGRPGHPVGFGPALIPKLKALQGDVAAKTLPQHCHLIALEDLGAIADIDSPDDLRSWQ